LFIEKKKKKKKKEEEKIKVRLQYTNINMQKLQYSLCTKELYRNAMRFPTASPRGLSRRRRRRRRRRRNILAKKKENPKVVNNVT